MARVDEAPNVSQIKRKISGLRLLKHNWLVLNQCSPTVIHCIGAKTAQPYGRRFVDTAQGCVYLRLDIQCGSLRRELAQRMFRRVRQAVLVARAHKIPYFRQGLVWCARHRIRPAIYAMFFSSN